jgi:hypothetical protein
MIIGTSSGTFGPLPLFRICVIVTGFFQVGRQASLLFKKRSVTNSAAIFDVVLFLNCNELVYEDAQPRSDGRFWGLLIPY